MLLIQLTIEALSKFTGRDVIVHTKDFDNARNTFHGILGDFKPWRSVFIQTGYIPFFGMNTAIEKITTTTGEVIFQNEFVGNTTFKRFPFGDEDARMAYVNELRKECFGEGHDLK